MRRKDCWRSHSRVNRRIIACSDNDAGEWPIVILLIAHFRHDAEDFTRLPIAAGIGSAEIMIATTPAEIFELGYAMPKSELAGHALSRRLH